MANNVKQAPIPVVPRTMKIVNVDGTITRSGQQLLEQLQAPSATAGTHGDRPNPGDVPEGSLWYENDRGVLYASTLGVWQYVAGTMYGTLSPDERPTDLATHDAGFNFRTIVAPAREFLWSQAEWIEVTAVQYGPHSARPNPATIVQGALYVEGDRGGVIYQVESPAGTNLWQYLAGTMWGTLSPDQRPIDLGVHDAGFDFRTTVAPPREFVWNQTAWTETTPVGGAVNLTHPNVVTKVGSTQGQIVEGGITDESAANSDRLHITPSGNVGIGIPPQVLFQAGSTPNSAGVEPRTDGFPIGGVGASNAARIGGFYSTNPIPGTAVHFAAQGDGRQGAIALLTKAVNDDTTQPSPRLTITPSGNVGIGTTAPGSRLAVVGLPTSSAGLASGDIWRDPAAANVLKIVP